MKISIITINFNNADGLEKTIKSVINQKNAMFEYLVIDGGSSDKSLEKIIQYQNKIDHFVSEPDNGIYHAMNKGIKASSGDYLLFLNSGDILATDNVIERVIASELTTDLTTGNMIYNNDNKREWIPADELTFSQLYSMTIPHPTTFIKRELFDTVGLYDETLKIVSDWKFFILAACKHACTYRHINIFISEFDERGISSDPKNAIRIAEERAYVINENFPAFISDYEELKAARKQLKKLRTIIKTRNFFKALLR